MKIDGNGPLLQRQAPRTNGNLALADSPAQSKASQQEGTTVTLSHNYHHRVRKLVDHDTSHLSNQAHYDQSVDPTEMDRGIGFYPSGYGHHD